MTKYKIKCRVKALNGIVERVLDSASFLPSYCITSDKLLK